MAGIQGITVKDLKIDINVAKAASGFSSIILGIVLYFINRSKSNKKSITLASLILAITGCALIGSVMEESFKPVDVDSVDDNDVENVTV